MPAYFAERALLPGGWANAVRFEVSSEGLIGQVQADASAEGAERLHGPVLPGMPNLHSHAFQRAMAGLAEVAGNPNDSFWTWRDLMYRLVGRITPEQLEVIARQLYIEMLKAGYTGVAEFHYVHHDGNGRPYANPAEHGAAHQPGGARGGHRPDSVAGALFPLRLRRPGAERRPAPLHQRHRRLPRPAGAPARAARRGADAAGRPVLPLAARGDAAADHRGRWSRTSATGRSTSTSPSSRRKSTTAWPGAVAARCNGCTTTSRWTSAGAWCTPPTRNPTKSAPWHKAERWPACA